MRISTLSQQDITFFRDKKIIIYGFGTESKKLYEVFEFFDIEVIAFCSDLVRYRLNTGYNNVPIITSKKLVEISKTHKNVMVQCMQQEPRKLACLKSNLSALGLDVSSIDAGQFIASFSPTINLKSFYQKKIYQREYKKWKIELKKRTAFDLFRWILTPSTNHIILCLPTKTADHSIGNTFDLLNRNQKLISYKNFFHKPRYIKKHLYKKRFKKLKIITAVREPISQNLSIAYQEFACGGAYKDWIIGDLERKTGVERAKTFCNLENLFVNNGNDVQLLWDAFVERYIYPKENMVVKSILHRSIQSFFSEFKTYALDITAYPFDQEKGYAIIKDGNMEIFVYQLEKLNNLIPELSEWVGVPFDKLENSNQASDKWIADSYKQAQKELEITQEYFDKCFDEPYVKHCYSEADIEKFKKKWRVHIK